MKRSMNSWTGHTQKELVETFGPPSRIDPDGKGGEVLTYNLKIKAVEEGEDGTGPRRNPSASDPSLMTVSRQFYLDRNGIIYGNRLSEY